MREEWMTSKQLEENKLGPNWEGPYRVIACERIGSYQLEDMSGKKLLRPWNADNLKNTS